MLAVAAAVGVVVERSRAVGLALAALVLGVGVLIADPLLLVVIALPGSLLIQRIGGSSTNLSAADLLVFVGALVSLFFIRWSEAPTLREFLRGIVWFQAVLVLVLVAHPNRYNIVEWFHRWSYLGGSVLVGWAIATYGRTKQAVRIYLLGASVIALIAMEHAVTQGFVPAQWGVYQKNAIGAIMLIAVLIAQINPPWTGIGRREARVNKYLCVGGLLASQSRQAAILLILALALAYFLNPELRSRSKLLLAGAVPLVVALYYSFTINARVNPKFNSVSVRVDQISAAFHVWHLSPVFGEGMRFYNLPQFLFVTAPPNVFIDNLASTGIVGSLAFLFMVFVTMRTLIRIPYVYGTLGMIVLLAHYVDGLFDIFWIGASSIAPFIIAGISLGIADLHRSGDAWLLPDGSTKDLAGRHRGPAGRGSRAVHRGSLAFERSFVAVRRSTGTATAEMARLMGRLVPAR
ncbi:MAG: O-antigen ligase family protein [Acidimicrobiales bacterium]